MNEWEVGLIVSWLAARCPLALTLGYRVLCSRGCLCLSLKTFLYQICGQAWQNCQMCGCHAWCMYDTWQVYRSPCFRILLPCSLLICASLFLMSFCVSLAKPLCSHPTHVKFHSASDVPSGSCGNDSDVTNHIPASPGEWAAWVDEFSINRCLSMPVPVIIRNPRKTNNWPEAGAAELSLAGMRCGVFHEASLTL